VGARKGEGKVQTKNSYRERENVFITPQRGEKKGEKKERRREPHASKNTGETLGCVYETTDEVSVKRKEKRGRGRVGGKRREGGGSCRMEITLMRKAETGQ